jgi:penicillin-binding protein 2
MYNLLTSTSQQQFSLAEFGEHYQLAQSKIGVTAMENQLQALLAEGNQAAVNFHTVLQTNRFGVIEADNQMHLQFVNGRWGVVWQPTLILPQLGQGVTIAFLGQQPVRGNIYDRNSHALATQGEIVTVGVVPQFITDEAELLRTLSNLTQVSPVKIKESIAAAQPNWFVPIADISFDTSLQYDDLFNAMAGVDRRTRTVRVYVDGDTAAHLVGYMGSIPAEAKDQYLAKGYTGDELVGLSGVEAWAEPDLAGQRGGRLVTLAPAPSQQVLSELATIPLRAGSSVYLTLDTGLQMTVEQLLGPRKGAVVVINPTDGAIYAMATYPRFKPAVLTTGFDVEGWARLYNNPNRPMLNRAAQGTYPPGSVFKIATLSATLEALKLDPHQIFTTCHGTWNGLGAEFTKKCWLERGHGPISLLDGLTQSCNVVFYEAGLALHRQDPDLLPTWARAFGLGQPTAIVGLAEESGGVIPDNAWMQANFNQPLYEGDAVNSAIGQGFVLTTPLQIARLMAAIANGGQLVRPRLLSKITPIEGPETVIQPEVAGKLPLLPENLALIKTSLEAITSSAYGTARAAFAGADYTVAGKTGTAESGRDEPHAWFAGYAPADAPRVVIAVILEEAGEGSKVAAPLFRQVLEAFFAWEKGQVPSN